jgi:hypothetical protein
MQGDQVALIRQHLQREAERFQRGGPSRRCRRAMRRAAHAHRLRPHPAEVVYSER